MIFVFVFICLLLIDRSFIFDVLRRRVLRHRDHLHREIRLRRRDYIRHLPCYDRLDCCCNEFGCRSMGRQTRRRENCN